MGKSRGGAGNNGQAEAEGSGDPAGTQVHGGKVGRNTVIHGGQVPEPIQAAVKTLLNWCNVYRAEGGFIKDLDLEQTPIRVARMLRYELLRSYQSGALDELKERMTTFALEKDASRDMVVQRGIYFHSLCAHHMLPFAGTVSLGYIPKDKLVGLSKLSRVVDHFSAQLQLQERLTSQIAGFLEEQLEPQAVVVVTAAEHECMSCRGVRKIGAETITSAVRGLAMKDDSVKAEFYRLIGYPRGT